MRLARTLTAVTGLSLVAAGLGAQDAAGRVFLPTAETVSIHEFNALPGADLEAIPTGTIVQDLSGNGLHATVEANAQGELVAAPGDPAFDDPPGSNRECRRAANLSGGARVAVNDDGGAYEMEPGDDFSIELYVNRESLPGSANWGILAGTWHSRNLLDDGAGNPDANGAWYGYTSCRDRRGPAVATLVVAKGYAQGCRAPPESRAVHRLAAQVIGS